MTIDKSFLESRYAILPFLTSCRLYARKANSALGDAIQVNTAEIKGLDENEEKMFQDVEAAVGRTSIHLWTHSFVPSTIGQDVDVKKHWVVKMSNGDEWIVITAKLEMSGTRWRCMCIENIDDYFVPV